MREQKKQNGYVLATVAAVIFVLLGFAALGVDMGVLYSSRAAASRTADAAAVAGAFTFINEPKAQQPATAQQEAMQVALSNNILGATLQTSEVSVNVDVANRRVTVRVTHKQPTFFAKALLQNSATISAQGVAEASAESTGSRCAKPFFIPNTIFADPATIPCNACISGTELLVDANGNPTAFAQTQIGKQFKIKPQRPDQALAPGQFYALQLSAASGASVYRDTIATCAPFAAFCRKFYSVETGNMVGPTIQGVNDLIGAPNADTYIGQDGLGRFLFKRQDGTITTTSRSLVVAPIWDSCYYVRSDPSFCPDAKWPTGTKVEIQVVAFAFIFLEGVQGNNVVARLLDVKKCPGEEPTAGETGPYSVPLRLVRPQ